MATVCTRCLGCTAPDLSSVLLNQWLPTSQACAACASIALVVSLVVSFGQANDSSMQHAQLGM
jgi:hypothetical protein